jgi:glucokinase
MPHPSPAPPRRRTRSDPRPGALGGLDLGGTKIQAVIVDADRSVLGQARRPTPQDGPAAVATAMVEVLKEAAEQAQIPSSQLAGVGVGSPGSVGPDGTVSHARNLHDWDNAFPLGPTLSQALGTRVEVGNDVEVAVLGEFHLGAGRPYRSLLGVWWGTGVGGGLILNGQVWRGRGSAGEIGHTVVRRGGARCTCGRRGCLEAYAGRAAMTERAWRESRHGRSTQLFDLAAKEGRQAPTSGTWARALAHRDPLATRLLRRAVRSLGAGIASAVNLLDVEAIVIGGGLGTRFGQAWADRIAAAMQPHLFVPEHPPAVLTTGLGDLGGAIGATLLVAAPPAS